MKFNSSIIGFLSSLFLHSILAFLLIYFIFFQHDDSANGYNAPIGTNISIEMLKGMVKATPTPIAEKIEEPIVQPIIEKEKIADPTKKEKKEVKKEIKKTPKKIIQKPKIKKKEKPKKQQKHRKHKKQEKRQGHKNINAKDNINSQASATHAATTNNPNLIGTGKNKDLLAAYKSAIRRAIERNKRYPNRAKLMRKQGVVTVSFHINKNGDLIRIHIQKSSNNRDLDKAALKAVKKVNGMGPPPAGIPLNLSIPIQFKIH